MCAVTKLLSAWDRVLYTLLPWLRTPVQEAHRLAPVLKRDLRRLGRDMGWPSPETLVTATHVMGQSAEVYLIEPALKGWHLRAALTVMAATVHALERRGWTATVRAAASVEMRVADLRCTVVCPRLGAPDEPRPVLVRMWLVSRR